MIRRPRRSLPATLVALVLLAVTALVALSCIQVLLGRVPLIPFTAVPQVGATLNWDDPAVIAAGTAGAVLGLVLLAAGALPGRPTVLPLSGSSERISTGVSRRSLRRELTTTIQYDGITATRVSVGRGVVRATVRAPSDETAELREQVRSLLTDRLAEIALARQPRARVRVSTQRRS